MSCNHMYVTEADKTLEMCGHCGVTYGEWHDGNVSTYRDGVYAERERIIKLLEENQMTYHLVSINGETLEHTAPLAAPLDKVIALIKGEK